MKNKIVLLAVLGLAPGVALSQSPATTNGKPFVEEAKVFANGLGIQSNIELMCCFASSIEPQQAHICIVV